MNNSNDTFFHDRVSLYEELLNSLPVAILLLDLQGVVRFVNKSAVVTLGYLDVNQLIGRRFRDILKSSVVSSSLEAECSRCMITAAIHTGGCYSCKDELVVSTDGVSLPISFFVVPLFDPSGLLAGGVVTFIDRTKERGLEGQLDQIRNFEKLSNHVSGVAHDFNNILTSIVGFATLLEMRLSPGDPLVKNVRQILAATERAAGLTRLLVQPDSRTSPEDKQTVTIDETTSLVQLRGSETILIAEDDPAVRALNKRLCEQFGYTVIEAGEGESALKAYIGAMGMINLSVLDVIMPKKSGVDLYKDIKCLDPSARVIFLSGYSDQYLRGQGLSDDVCLLKKPVTPLMFLRTVRVELDKGSKESDKFTAGVF